ncbi:MAG: SH3 domain-containing protein [Rubrivivax sp.]|nr:SH3 domain-containing protein [Rubrivivax sp.]
MQTERRRWGRSAARAVLLTAGLLPALVGLRPAAAQTAAAPSAPGAASVTTPSQPPDAASERLVVADPFLELHTGPGRGYPVFHVAARGEWVEIRLRHTDWFQVRTDKGIEGWVQRAQLQGTLTAAGAPKTFRDLLLDDYLARRLELGAAWGRFKSEPLLKVFVSYRLTEAFHVEGTLGQVQGVFSGTDYWHLNLHTEPWSDRRLSPSFGIGFGRFRNLPNASLVGTQVTDTPMAQMTLGLRWHLSDRFILRADYGLHTAYLDNRRTGEYRSLSTGLSFFFR